MTEISKNRKQKHIMLPPNIYLFTPKDEQWKTGGRLVVSGMSSGVDRCWLLLTLTSTLTAQSGPVRRADSTPRSALPFDLISRRHCHGLRGTETLCDQCR